MQQTIWSPFILEEIRPLPLIKCRNAILLETAHVGLTLGNDFSGLWGLLHRNAFQIGSRILVRNNCELLAAVENKSGKLQANYLNDCHWGSLAMTSDRIAALQVGIKTGHNWYGAEVVYGSLSAGLSFAFANESLMASLNPLIGQVSIGHTVSVHDNLKMSALLNANLFNGVTSSLLSISFCERLHIQVSPSGAVGRMEVSYGPLRALLSRHSVAISYAMEK